MQLDLQEIMTLIGCVKENGLTSFAYSDHDIQISMANEKNGSGNQLVHSSEQPVFTSGPAPVFNPALQQSAIQPVAAKQPVVESEAAAQTAAQPVAETQVTEEAQPQGRCLTSPIVGTFYAAPAEDAEPFVKVGDHIEKGQIIGIVEAMKLMNEIEAEESGTVAEILVENASVVECGQPLIRIV